MADWKTANPEKVRASAAQTRQKLKADPARHAHMREMENANRRRKTKRGESFVAECARCGHDFSYEFVQKHRTVCDLCRSYDSEWQNFGLTGPAADEIRQIDHCAICGTDRPGGKMGRRFHIDHDHETGRIRGVICSPCNSVLGLMGDDPARLHAAADYLDHEREE